MRSHPAGQLSRRTIHPLDTKTAKRGRTVARRNKSGGAGSSHSARSPCNQSGLIAMLVVTMAMIMVVMTVAVVMIVVIVGPPAKSLRKLCVLLDQQLR
jgi:hypothetical protein